MFKACVWEKWITALKSLRIRKIKRKMQKKQKKTPKQKCKKKKQAYGKIILHNMKNCAVSAGSPLPESSLPWNLLWRVGFGGVLPVFSWPMEILPQLCFAWGVICGITDKGKFCEKYEQKNNLWCCSKKCQFDKCHEPIKLYKYYFYTIYLHWWSEFLVRDGLLFATVQCY